MEDSKLLGTEIVKLLPKKTHKVYLILDRHNCEENSTRNKFTWNVKYTKELAPNSVYVTSRIKHILSMRLLDFQFNGMNVSDAFNGQDYAQVSVFIPEFAAQSFQSGDNKFHFLGNYTDETPKTYNYDWFGTFVDQTPKPYVSFSKGLLSTSADDRKSYGNEGKFTFDKPMTLLNTISVQFGRPFAPLSLRYYKIPITVDADGYYITFDSVHYPYNVMPNTAFSIENNFSHNTDDWNRDPIFINYTEPAPGAVMIIKSSLTYYAYDTYYVSFCGSVDGRYLYFPDLGFKLHLELEVEFHDDALDLTEVKSSTDIMPILKQLYIQPKTTILYLNTRYRNLFKSSLQKSVWDLATQESINTDNKAVSIPSNMHNIIGIKLHAVNFRTNGTQMTWLGTDVVKFPGWINILIEEFAEQCYLQVETINFKTNTLRYHFPCKLIKSTNQTVDIPSETNSFVPLSKEFFMFDKPVRTMPDTLSLSCSIYNANVHFPQIYEVIQHIGMVGLQMEVFFQFFDGSTTLKPGDIIYFYDLVPIDPADQYMCDLLMRREGFPIVSCVQTIVGMDVGCLVYVDFDTLGVGFYKDRGFSSFNPDKDNIIPVSFLHY